MSIQISGTIREAETGRPIPSLVVQVYDADVLSDDFLGHTATDSEGSYHISVPGKRRFWEECPDLYVIVKSRTGRILTSTRKNQLRDVQADVTLDVSISCFKLLEAGLIQPDALPKHLQVLSADPSLKKWTLIASTPPAEFAAIEADLAPCASLLDLLAGYMRTLRKSADNRAPEYRKLHTLFSLGLTPRQVEGHHYGVALGLRTHADPHPLSRFDNVVGLLWGATLQDESPWVGKSFSPLDENRLKGLTGEANPPRTPTFLGINHFNRVDFRAANQVTFHALSYWLNLEDAPTSEKATFANERNGGNFIARQEPSVWPESPREVFSLNYRWASMQNRPPLSWLVDEIVQISDGLYLGQLLFASHHLFSGFDPALPSAEYDYRHMGYFLLWDERWNAEARRLFSFLEIPATAPGVHENKPTVILPGSRFTRLTLEAQPPTNCNNLAFAEVTRDLAKKESLLHLLKSYSDDLQDLADNDSPIFTRLQELFNRAAPVASLTGYLRGALISWHGAGVFSLGPKNLLNQAWGLSSRFSPWTGKRFDPISPERLRDLTDGFETGDIPTMFGANTQALRTLREKQIGKLMELAQIWGEEATQAERTELGYDLKNFFFISHASTSLNPNNAGKRIYQLNYRWPKLRTIIPDRYCIDELVQLSEGLYLGQLMYATDWTLPYDPHRNPADYKYGQFGYFLLLDEAWQQIRLRIGFDLENS
jgi:hypothetical protein